MNRAPLYPTIRLVALTSPCLALTAGCDSEPPPPAVVDFIENPRLLEATMVRCAARRAELKYTPECLNAREAVDRLAAGDEAERRKELEAQSARKREALRRAQQAAAEARARAAEEERQRREAEYLSQFEETPPAGGGSDAGGSVATESPPALSGSQPPAAPRDETTGQANERPTDWAADADATSPAVREQRPAGVQTFPQAPAELPPAGDLESVRDELRRRAQTGDPQDGQ